jgi:type II secretory pathway component PulM
LENKAKLSRNISPETQCLVAHNVSRTPRARLIAVEMVAFLMIAIYVALSPENAFHAPALETPFVWSTNNRRLSGA